MPRIRFSYLRLPCENLRYSLVSYRPNKTTQSSLFLSLVLAAVIDGIPLMLR